jgi:uncharacterized protein YlaI
LKCSADDTSEAAGRHGTDVAETARHEDLIAIAVVLLSSTMKMNWPQQRCILCLEPGAMTEEHVIPEQIGGKLTAYFLCNDCNSRLGSEVEPAVKRDPSIRLAVEHLADKMPALAAAMRDGLEFIGRGPAGQFRGTVKGGRFKMTASRGPDGSLDQDLRDSRKNVRHRLEKRGVHPALIEKAMALFDSAPLDAPVALPGGVGIIHREAQLSLSSVLDGPLLDERVLLKIAYEVLALHIGESIYDTVPALNELRAAIRDGQPRPDFHEVEYLTSRKYTPIHGLAIVGLPHVAVTICFFDWLRYRVHLKRVAVNPPNWIYGHQLDTGSDGWEPLPDKDEGDPPPQ